MRFYLIRHQRVKLPFIMDATKAFRAMAFVCRCTKHLNPPGLASLFVRSRAYQTSVTLPASVVPALALWTRIVSALFTSMNTRKFESMDTMTCPAVLLVPLVMAVAGYDSKPTHTMPPLGIWNKLT